MIIKCAICNKIKVQNHYETIPKEIENMQHVQVIQSLCPDCGKDLEIKLLGKLKAMESRIDRLALGDKAVVVFLILMIIVTAWCGISHWLKP